MSERKPVVYWAGVAAGWEGAKVRVAAREAVAQVVGCHKERR